MACSSIQMRNIFTHGVVPLDPNEPTPPTLSLELADMIGGWLEQMEIEDARQEHENKFQYIWMHRPGRGWECASGTSIRTNTDNYYLRTSWRDLSWLRGGRGWWTGADDNGRRIRKFWEPRDSLKKLEVRLKNKAEMSWILMNHIEQSRIRLDAARK